MSGWPVGALGPPALIVLSTHINVATGSGPRNANEQVRLTEVLVGGVPKSHVGLPEGPALDTGVHKCVSQTQPRLHGVNGHYELIAQIHREQRHFIGRHGLHSVEAAVDDLF